MVELVASLTFLSYYIFYFPHLLELLDFLAQDHALKVDVAMLHFKILLEIISTLLFLFPLYNHFFDFVLEQVKVIQLSQRYMLKLFVREHRQLIAFEQDLNVTELVFTTLALGA